VQEDSTLAFPFFSINIGLSGCVEANPEDFPIYAPRWTCGIRVRGKALCEGLDESEGSASASASTSSDDGNDDGTISVASSSERGGTAIASASSSGGDGPAQSTSGGFFGL
jgi:hypothetical protein